MNLFSFEEAYKNLTNGGKTMDVWDNISDNGDSDFCMAGADEEVPEEFYLEQCDSCDILYEPDDNTVYICSLCQDCNRLLKMNPVKDEKENNVRDPEVEEFFSRPNRKLRAGVTDKKRGKEYTKLVECDCCYAKTWIKPDETWGLCKACSKSNTRLGVTYVGGSGGSFHTPTQKPERCEPKRPAIEWIIGRAVPQALPVSSNTLPVLYQPELPRFAAAEYGETPF